MKILIAGGGTGGHLIPALAIADALRAARPDVDVLFVGAERGIEATLLPQSPYRHVLLPLEPIYRHSWWKNFRWPALAVHLWSQIGRLLETERPDVVLGTGGYVAGPVVWHAQRSGIPTAIQEQNAFPGLATRWLAKRARHVYLGFPEARARLSPGAHAQVFDFGNPIRPPEAGDRDAAVREFGLDPARPTVLAFGGSQGARAINYAVAGMIEHGLLGDINLLWGTGAANHAELAGYARPGVVALRGFFDPMAVAYRAADLVVSRAGAMTVAELCAWGKPSILIPLPTAAADHQTDNARALVDARAAVMLEESALSAHSLARAIGVLILDPGSRDALARAAASRGHPDAARDVVSKLLTLKI
jgi:UDP-N-acetylglucosamine--N-acetylmuramyl-(pentapeptide) pyrophosphoryl-undecaprenol N-acetylglucosamine transferase